MKTEIPSVVADFNAVKGFLNLVITPASWIGLLTDINQDAQFGLTEATDHSPLVMIEYSSPNTNKPLHLGHVRNNLLGCALANIMAANGNRVVKTNIVNDRGIHICKSMLAWLKYGNGATPESTGIKGDHLIGDYYVAFDKHYKEQIKELMEGGMSEEEAKKSGHEIKAVKVPMLFSGRYVAENVRGEGFCKLVYDVTADRLLGVQMVGSYASEIIYGAGMMVQLALPLEQLKKIVFPHPSVCEVLREGLFML